MRPGPSAAVPRLREEDAPEPEWPQGGLPLRRCWAAGRGRRGVPQAEERVRGPGVRHQVSLRAGRVFSTFPVSGRSRRKKAVKKGNQVLVDVLLQVGLSKGRRHLYSDLECPRGSQAPFPPWLL